MLTLTISNDLLYVVATYSIDWLMYMEYSMPKCSISITQWLALPHSMHMLYFVYSGFVFLKLFVAVIKYIVLSTTTKYVG